MRVIDRQNIVEKRKSKKQMMNCNDSYRKHPYFQGYSNPKGCRRRDKGELTL